MLEDSKPTEEKIDKLLSKPPKEDVWFGTVDMSEQWKRLKPLTVEFFRTYWNMFVPYAQLTDITKVEYVERSNGYAHR